MKDTRVVSEMLKFKEIGQSKPVKGMLHVYNAGGSKESYAVVDGKVELGELLYVKPRSAKT
jgi:hypothetical protein